MYSGLLEEAHIRSSPSHINEGKLIVGSMDMEIYTRRSCHHFEALAQPISEGHRHSDCIHSRYYDAVLESLDPPEDTGPWVVVDDVGDILRCAAQYGVEAITMHKLRRILV